MRTLFSRLSRLILPLALCVLALGQSLPTLARDTRADFSGGTSLAELPPEARATLILIQRGGPFPYRRDGVVFENREYRLPPRPRGYYREYTVPTPGSRDRGARRIIAGGEPPQVYFYTADHYRSFQPIRP